MNVWNPPERTCKTCGKIFICHDPYNWVYKKSMQKKKNNSALVYFCSWGCMRKWEKEREEKKKRMREVAVAQVKEGAVAPVSEVKTRYTINRCGKCGRRVAIEQKYCGYCKTPIDWSKYEKKRWEVEE